ncbi:uncharacterized protein PSFLO_00973 [Pseudozyma flocculosa]|nr:uncharacterized protein PSFLO_00973 [Pseudozyma flocculosa]
MAPLRHIATAALSVRLRSRFTRTLRSHARSFSSAAHRRAMHQEMDAPHYHGDMIDLSHIKLFKVGPRPADDTTSSGDSGWPRKPWLNSSRRVGRSIRATRLQHEFRDGLRRAHYHKASRKLRVRPPAAGRVIEAAVREEIIKSAVKLLHRLDRRRRRADWEEQRQLRASLQAEKRDKASLQAVKTRQDRLILQLNRQLEAERRQNQQKDRQLRRLRMVRLQTASVVDPSAVPRIEPWRWLSEAGRQLWLVAKRSVVNQLTAMQRQSDLVRLYTQQTLVNHRAALRELPHRLDQRLQSMVYPDTTLPPAERALDVIYPSGVFAGGFLVVSTRWPAYWAAVRHWSDLSEVICAAPFIALTVWGFPKLIRSFLVPSPAPPQTHSITGVTEDPQSLQRSSKDQVESARHIAE